MRAKLVVAPDSDIARFSWPLRGRVKHAIIAGDHMRATRRLLRGLTASLFGGSCYLCRGAAEGVLCADCENDLPRAPAPRCPRCALPAPASGGVCGRCVSDPPRFDATLAAFSYAFPADVLVHALKFQGQLAIAGLFGRRLLAELPRAERIDVLAPVPLSSARLRERGYNQSLEIGRALAEAAAELDPQLIERERDTPPQADLPWAERARNVRGAFRCSRALGGARVAVVDDVMTTGATLDEVAGALKRAGAALVVNWVAVRTLPPAQG
jgi:ComF family protein